MIFFKTDIQVLIGCTGFSTIVSKCSIVQLQSYHPLYIPETNEPIQPASKHLQDCTLSVQWPLHVYYYQRYYIRLLGFTSPSTA